MAHLALIPAMLIGAGITAAGTVAASALAKQPTVTPALAQPTITQNPAAAALRNADLLRQRQGAAANNLTGGTAMAPVTAGARALFGQGG